MVDILLIFAIIYLTREPLAKIAPYFTRAGALFFVLYYRYDKGNYSTKHDDKSKQVTVCNHKHQPPFFCSAADIAPQRFPG